METRYLSIDASTYGGSVAVVTGDGRVVAEATVVMRGESEERLMPAVAALLEECGGAAAPLDGVVCGAGPGSFTSLRIAASIAKGIAHGRSIPLYSLSSLLLTAAAHRDIIGPGLYLSMIDAMRGDFHTLVVRITDRLEVHASGEPRLLPAHAATALSMSTGAVPLGPGRELDFAPHARGAAVLLPADGAGEVDLISWEPDYGRPAQAELHRVRPDSGR